MLISWSQIEAGYGWSDFGCLWGNVEQKMCFGACVGLHTRRFRRRIQAGEERKGKITWNNRIQSRSWKEDETPTIKQRWNQIQLRSRARLVSVRLWVRISPAQKRPFSLKKSLFYTLKTLKTSCFVLKETLSYNIPHKLDVILKKIALKYKICVFELVFWLVLEI